ncbi:MAG TPA: DUF3616 domain-containing protein [Verrucomicrobiae bacterium]
MKRMLQCWVIMISSAIATGAEKFADEDAKPSFLGEPTMHIGCCDASAGVAVSSNLFLIANDEDNSLRVYRSDRSGPPVQSFQTGPFLHVDPRKPESDLEGAARVGDRIYWITSHGRNRDGEERESRYRFFATTFSVTEQGKVELRAVGRPYTRLLDDMIKDARLAPFRLGAAAMHAPKDTNGLNIEGVCATPEGEILIGFRNPIPQGRALIVPLKNPAELLEGKTARFGAPLLLDLGGRGVRDMAAAGGRYWIIGGSFDGSGKFHLYSWDGGTNAAQKIPEAKFKGANPEALLVYPEAPPNEFQILSDDGTRKIAGQDCKAIKDPARKWFRSFWIRLE